MAIPITELDPVFARFAVRDAADPETYPAANIAELHEAGLIRGPFPPAQGGLGWSLADAVDFIEALSSASASTALIAAMPIGLAAVYAAGDSIAPGHAVGDWRRQVDEAAAEYRAGRLYAACNSEKGAGGALTAISTRANRSADGSFQLTGEKILASGGRHAAQFFSTAKVDPGDLPGAAAVELFLVRTDAPGVSILDDWDGFGMRSTESQTVRYDGAEASVLGFPNFIETTQPFGYWFCLFAAIPLGCARGILRSLEVPAPASPALRLRLSEARMRYESLRAYLRETAQEWCYGSTPGYRAKVLRTKTFVTQESTKLAAELFALSGGRNYRRSSAMARALADSFAGTALRPPLALGLDTLVSEFGVFED